MLRITPSQPFFLQIRRFAILGFLVTLTDPLSCLFNLQTGRKGQGISDLRDVSIPTDLLQKKREVCTVLQALEVRGVLESRMYHTF